MDIRGKARVGDGSEAAPSLTFRLDPDTGIYRPGTNRLIIATAGADRWEVDANGHLIPSDDNTYDIGNSTHDVKDVYVQGQIKGSGTVQGLVGGATTAVTDDTAAATGVDEPWGTETATITNPGRQVRLTIWLNGYCQATAGTARMACQAKIGYLTDGGSTYTVAADSAQADVDFDLAIRNSALSAIFSTVVTPTGDIKIRPYLRQNTGVAGDVSFNNGYIIAHCLPA